MGWDESSHKRLLYLSREMEPDLCYQNEVRHLSAGWRWAMGWVFGE